MDPLRAFAYPDALTPGSVVSGSAVIESDKCSSHHSLQCNFRQELIESTRGGDNKWIERREHPRSLVTCLLESHSTDKARPPPDIHCMFLTVLCLSLEIDADARGFCGGKTGKPFTKLGLGWT
jgi:hypothetical protein